MFRLSAPSVPADGDKPAGGNGVSRHVTSETAERRQINNGQTKTPANGRVNGAMETTSSSMLPPPGKRVKERDGEQQANGRGGEGGASQQRTPAGRKASSSSTAAQVASEEAAMLAANLPSSFGAARDKPLGKKSMRPKKLIGGGAGGGLSGVAGRFVAGKAAGAARDESSATDKTEARRRREAEIAAMTAEMTRTEDVSEGGEKKDGGEDTAARFTPGAWRHSGAGSGAGRQAVSVANRDGAVGVRSRTRREIDEGEEEEEEVPMEEEEEEQEEITEEMRIRQVVRRLGLPVSHEVKLSGHTKGVTALALDRAGGRIATGSMDYKVKVVVFGGVSRACVIKFPARARHMSVGNLS